MEILSTLSALLFCGDESTACAATIDGGANVCCVHRMVGCGREEEEVGWEAVAEVEKFSLLGKCALSRTCTNYILQLLPKMLHAHNGCCAVVTRSVGGVYADGDGCYGDRFDRVTHVEEVCLPEVQSQLARKRDFFYLFS